MGRYKGYVHVRDPVQLLVNYVHYIYIYICIGARGGVMVKALRYKPARRGFDSRWCHWNFSVT
jgi:hypothetical protein